SASQYSGLSVLAMLTVLKATFLIGSLLATVIGFRTRSQGLRRESLALLGIFAVLLMAVTVNNIWVMDTV
ncbi:MAG TPA: hypothetical protein VLY65_00190, partial [Nitrososphaerales archaeon]|nr:hypothetical protein [Nitrososphaerales archaeon]